MRNHALQEECNSYNLGNKINAQNAYSWLNEGKTMVTHLNVLQSKVNLKP